MTFLRHSQHVPQNYRKLLVVLIAIVTITSTNIQSASAMELLPPAPTFSTATQMLYDAIQKTGFTVPDDEEIQSTEMTVEATDKAPVKYVKIYTVTAYNSVPWQTDATPCISADGSNICKLRDLGDQSCAAALPFGTKVNIPGFGVCTVRDRLAPRFSYRIDVYFGGADQIQTAKQWGKRHVNVEVLDKT